MGETEGYINRQMIDGEMATLDSRVLRSQGLFLVVLHTQPHLFSPKQHLTTHISPFPPKKKEKKRKKKNYILLISPSYASPGVQAPSHAPGTRAPRSHWPGAPVRAIPTTQ